MPGEPHPAERHDNLCPTGTDRTTNGRDSNVADRSVAHDKQFDIVTGSDAEPAHLPVADNTVGFADSANTDAQLIRVGLHTEMPAAGSPGRRHWPHAVNAPKQVGLIVSSRPTRSLPLSRTWLRNLWHARAWRGVPDGPTSATDPMNPRASR